MGIDGGPRMSVRRGRWPGWAARCPAPTAGGMDGPGRRRRRGHRGRRRDRQCEAAAPGREPLDPPDGTVLRRPDNGTALGRQLLDRRVGHADGARLMRARPAGRRAAGCRSREDRPGPHRVRRPGLRSIRGPRRRGRRRCGATRGRDRSGAVAIGEPRALERLGSQLLPRPFQAHRHPVPHRQGRRGCGGFVRLLLGRCRFIGRIFRRIRVAGRSPCPAVPGPVPGRKLASSATPPSLAAPNSDSPGMTDTVNRGATRLSVEPLAAQELRHLLEGAGGRRGQRRARRRDRPVGQTGRDGPVTNPGHIPNRPGRPRD